MTNGKTRIPAIATAKAMFTTGACSTAVFQAVDLAFGHPLEAEERASAPLAGGIGNHGYQCGQIWGAVLAGGAHAHRVHGPGARAEAVAVHTAVRLVEAFEGAFRDLDCSDLTSVVWKDRDESRKGMWAFVLKGGPAMCAHMVVKYARIAHRVIEETVAEEPGAVPPCASCAAALARQMGASEQHAVMAAGLAGGLGLSGGGCGALAAAMWLTALAHPEEELGPDVEGTRIGTLIQRFHAATEYEFECSAIVGRTFEGAEDHARYVRGGGCAALLEALATTGDAESPQAA